MSGSFGYIKTDNDGEMSDQPHIKVEGFSQVTNDIVEHLDSSNDKISIHSNNLRQ